MTEKLYDENAYLTEFQATVLSVREENGFFYTVLDKTAFFPEGGGQGSDRGTLGGVPVLDVQITENGIEHKTEQPFSVGRTVAGEVDFVHRFDKMQMHTAEHILSGFIHKIYGYDNVGFHLGDDCMTIDTSGPLTRADLDRIETLANEAVYRNLPVKAYYPSQEELATLSYRSKLDLKENVRIVSIPDVDVCACCAPHVRFTGEIGLIKILQVEKHKDGVRLTAVAGKRALLDYRNKFENVSEISAKLSVKCEESAEAVKTLAEALAKAEYEINRLKTAEMKEKAALYVPKAGKDVVVFSDTTDDALRVFANGIAGKITSAVILLRPTEAGYRYLAVSGGEDLRQSVREWNLALSGKGGGSSAMVQGSFSASEDEIRAYFAK